MFGPTKPIAFPTPTSVTAQQLQTLKTASGQPRQGSQSPNPFVRGGSPTFPQHVSGVTAILKKSSDVSTKATITFQRSSADGLYVDSSVYVSGYQGNPQPVKVASGQSPISFPLNNTGESLAFTVQANGPTGSAPLSSAPTTTSKLVSTPLATVPTASGTGGGTGGSTGGGSSTASAYQWVTLVADNITDNRPVLAAALAAVPANGGTIYLIPVGSGTCVVSAALTITINNTVLIGSGWGITSLLGDQAACTLQFPAGQSGIIVNGAHSVIIQNLALLSKDTGANSSDNGLWFKGLAGTPTVRNVSVQHFGGIGILIDSTSSGNIDQWRIDQCFSYENFGDGFKIVGGVDGNVGIATGLNCTANGGWGMNLDSGAGANVFVIPQITNNAGGGVRVNTASNSFYDLYMENSAVSSFVITSSGNNNYAKFHFFGQPSTITNSGGPSNVFMYHDSNGFQGFANLTVSSQALTGGKSYNLNNGGFNANDFTILDDSNTAWLNINQGLGAVLFPQPTYIYQLANATLTVPQNSPELRFSGSYWNGSASAPDQWSFQNLIGAGTNGTSTFKIFHSSGSTGTKTIEFGNPVTCDSTLTVTGATQLNAGLIVVGATPAGAASQLGIGTTTGFGNGLAAQPVTTTLLGTGGGPATPGTIVNHLKVTIGGTVYYIPLVQ